jgi:hypothetical protein
MVNIKTEIIYIWLKLLMKRKLMMSVAECAICFDKDISMFD